MTNNEAYMEMYAAKNLGAAEQIYLEHVETEYQRRINALKIEAEASVTKLVMKDKKTNAEANDLVKSRVESEKNKHVAWLDVAKNEVTPHHLACAFHHVHSGKVISEDIIFRLTQFAIFHNSVEVDAEKTVTFGTPFGPMAMDLWIQALAIRATDAKAAKGANLRADFKKIKMSVPTTEGEPPESSDDDEADS